MKTSVDDVCRQAMQRHLLCHLPAISPSEAVVVCIVEQLPHIAAGSSGILANHEHLEALRDGPRQVCLISVTTLDNTDKALAELDELDNLEDTGVFVFSFDNPSYRHA